jgi:hypothetical protein
VPWGRAIVVWLLIIATESLHGTLRQLFLTPRIGDWPARRVGVIVGTVLIFVISLLTVRWLRVRDTGALLGVGALWVTLTVLFEVGLGRVVFAYPWGRILADYDLSSGGFMGFGLLAVLLMPLVAARVRKLDHAVL